MKSTTLIALLFSNVVSSAVIRRDGAEGQTLNKRQLSNFFGPGGKVKDPVGAAPRRQVLETPSKIPGAQRVKIRAGPYMVPGMGTKSMSGHAGMLENLSDLYIEKPCEECTLLWQRAGLEYPDGKNANIDTGLWLHHMVHFVSGPGRWDPTGYGKTCYPFYAILTTAGNSERPYTSGNERTAFDYNPKPNGLESGSGYHITKKDQFSYVVELMNMNMKDEVVYLTMTYDYLPGAHPKGWNEVKTFWLDANQCYNSEVAPPKETGTFTVESVPWTPNFEGKIMSAMGHVHDGGTKVDILMGGDSDNVCTTTTKYSETPEYTYKGEVMGKDKIAEKHISGMSGCKNQDVVGKQLTRNQSWVIKGHYDYDKHEGNLEGGKQSEIMTLGIVLVEVPPGGVKPLV